MYAAATPAPREYVPLAELHREEGVALYRAQKQCSSSGETFESVIIVETRASDAVHSAEAEYELLKRLHVYGATPEPVAWFRNDEFDTLVVRDEPSEGLVLGSQLVRKRQQQDLVMMEEFFSVARALPFLLLMIELEYRSRPNNIAWAYPQPTSRAWGR